MRYSQGDGVYTSLLKVGYCTHVLLCLGVCVCVCVDYPRYGHVLYGTIIKMMCLHGRYLQG